MTLGEILAVVHRRQGTMRRSRLMGRFKRELWRLKPSLRLVRRMMGISIGQVSFDSGGRLVVWSVIFI